MEFIKKHYEKLVLGVVLLAVAGLAIFLVFAVSQVRSDLESALQQFAGAKQKPLVPENLETNQTSLKRVTAAPPRCLPRPTITPSIPSPGRGLLAVGLSRPALVPTPELLD